MKIWTLHKEVHHLRNIIYLIIYLVFHMTAFFSNVIENVTHSFNFRNVVLALYAPKIVTSSVAEDVCSLL